MLSPRNIHYAILGIILGATSGYIFAFYQIDKRMPDKTKSLPGAADSGHPNVSDEQVLAMFKSQIEKNPDNPELFSRYGDFLSDTGRFEEAVDAYKKALSLDPSNLNAQTFMGTALWNMGKKDEATALYQKSLKTDPNHLPSLYYMAMVDLDRDKNVAAAEEKLAKMEKIDPSQPALKELRQRIDDAKKAK